MLKLNRFYRYLIYRLSHFDPLTPVINTISTLSIVHLLQLLCINNVIWYIFRVGELPNLSKFMIVIFLFLFWGINYALFYNKRKWQEYEEEFEKESPKERKIGLIKVLSYLIGSIAAFFIFMMVTFEQK